MRFNFEITFFFNHCGLRFEDQTLSIFFGDVNNIIRNYINYLLHNFKLIYVNLDKIMFN
jgi:hypothetical protein